MSTALREFVKSPPGPFLERSRDIRRRSWGRLGALSGFSWGPLMPDWSHLGASVGCQKRNGETISYVDFGWRFNVLGICWASLGSYLVTWSRHGAFLGPIGASWEPS
eukprot:2778925-Pyramimonas_sp.AAC.1